MKKEEVELMIIGVKMGNEDILNMKIYKDGTLTRSGCGGMPTFTMSGMTMEGDKKYWDQLITLVDEKIVETPINYQDEKITTPLEYYLVFFGVSSNGQTGERAAWTKNSGVRFLLDNDTSFRHPLLGFLDQFSIKAAEITNEWFFDIVMSAVYNLQPVGLENTFVTAPKTEAEKQEELSRYVNLMVANSSIGWNIETIGNGRKYKNPEGKELTSVVKNNAGQVSINFSEVFDINDAEAASKRIDQLLANMDNPKTEDPQNTKSRNSSPNNATNTDESVKHSNRQNAAKMLEDAKNKMSNTPITPKNIPAKKWWQFWK